MKCSHTEVYFLLQSNSSANSSPEERKCFWKFKISFSFGHLKETGMTWRSSFLTTWVWCYNMFNQLDIAAQWKLLLESENVSARSHITDSLRRAWFGQIHAALLIHTILMQHWYKVVGWGKKHHRILSSIAVGIYIIFLQTNIFTYSLKKRQ